MRKNRLLCALASISLFFPTCQKDQFECGAPNDSGQVRACNRDNEVCVCSKKRCAQPSSQCGSGYRYSFSSADDEDDGCVAATDRPSIVADDARFCPKEGPRGLPCGVTGGAACLVDEVCLCSVNRCVAVERTCPSGYVFSDSAECVAEGEARVERFAAVTSSNPEGLCPGSNRPLSFCGVRALGVEKVDCPEPQICVCAGDRFQCALQSKTCPEHYAWALDGSCVAGVTGSEIESEEFRVDEELFLCPQFREAEGGAAGASGAGASSGGWGGEGP